MRHQRPLRVQLLLGRSLLGHQIAVALQVQLGVAQLRLVTRQPALRDVQRNLKRLGVYLRQQLPRAHGLAFGEMDGLELTIRLGVHHRSIGSGDAADGVDDHADVAALHQSDRCRLGARGAE